MLPPIQTPTFKYPNSKLPNIDGAPIYANTGFSIDDPYLAVTDVPWQSGKSGVNKLISAAAPEMGSKLDYKLLGGRVTICVLCYGDHFGMHQRCLDSIMRTVPHDRMDLRICANEVGQASLNYFDTLPYTKLYLNEVNKFKYPSMRQMFHDGTCPITTPYTIWFDDNCHVQHNNWLNILATDIVSHGPKIAMYGIKLTYSADAGPGNMWYWLKERPWYNGRPMRNAAGVPSKTGDYIHFCADWFFAIRTEAIKQAWLPDEMLMQKGGDIVIGEQLYQAGLAIKSFNLGKAYIFQPNYRDQVIRNFDHRDLPWYYALA